MGLGFSHGVSTSMSFGFSSKNALLIPTVIITSEESSPTSANPIIITFAWSEGVYAFGGDSCTVTNGSVDTVIVDGQDLYRFEIIPDGAGDVTIKVNANGCYDISGNYCEESDLFTIEYAP